MGTLRGAAGHVCRRVVGGGTITAPCLVLHGPFWSRRRGTVWHGEGACAVHDAAVVALVILSANDLSVLLLSLRNHASRAVVERSWARGKGLG